MRCVASGRPPVGMCNDAESDRGERKLLQLVDYVVQRGGFQAVNALVLCPHPLFTATRRPDLLSSLNVLLLPVCYASTSVKNAYCGSHQKHASCHV